MADCVKEIISNEYADFIQVVARPSEYLLDSFETRCFNYVGEKYSIIYAPRSRIADIEIKNFGYSAIPKLYGLMDTTPLEVSGITKLQNQPILNLKGQGTIIGIIDTGIDYMHPAFRFPDGRTRILRIWDQTIQDGPIPRSTGYGTEYNRAVIDAAIENENPYNIVPSVDEIGHGTFMAGIAAGSPDKENDFIGVAPEAEIIMVKLKPAKEYLREFYRVQKDAIAYQENDIIMGLRYVKLMADLFNMPLALILGLGTNWGGHSGISLLSESVSDLSSFVGTAVTVAGGNEGDKRHHYRGYMENGVEYDEVQIKVGENEYGFSMELWGNTAEIFTISIVSSLGEVVPRIAARMGKSEELNFLFEDTVINVDYRIVETMTGNELIFVRFLKPTPGIWTIRVYGTMYISGSFDIWLPIEEFLSSDVYFLDPDPDITITELATAGGPITTGTYDSYTGGIYLASGRGYTRENNIKPEIVSPGVNVFGPKTGGGYTTKTGSSIAAAIAGGVTAQFLTWGIVNNNEKGIRTNDIKGYLIRGADRKIGMVYPNKSWGYGKLDAYNAFASLIV